MDNQTRLDDIIATYTDTILSGRDSSPPEEFASEARIIKALNRVIAPGDGLDAAMRSRLNQRVTAEWDQARQRRSSRRNILSFPSSAYGRLAVAAGIAIMIGVVAIVLSVGDTSGSDVSATAQGDSSALVVVIVMAVVVSLAGFLFFLWNRRQ